jgi:hypothetical protein
MMRQARIPHDTARLLRLAHAVRRLRHHRDSRKLHALIGRYSRARARVGRGAEHFKELIAAFKASAQTARLRGDLTNIWEVTGVRRSEVKITSFLAWLLNGRASHGLGHAFSRRLLQTTLGHETQGEVEVYRVSTEASHVGHDQCRVDLLLESSTALLVIEAKIDAEESEGQLAKYIALAGDRACYLGMAEWRVLFLSSRPPSYHHDNICHMTWREVADSLRSVRMRVSKEARTPAIVAQFEQHIRMFD